MDNAVTKSPAPTDATLLKAMSQGEPIEVGSIRESHLASPHPVSLEAAKRLTMSQIGVSSDRSFQVQISAFWDKLRRATTPEEKLTCERMINALGLARGMSRHEEGSQIAAANDADRKRKGEEDAERRAVDRWR